MAEYTIKCGCGRTMNPDGRHGHGAYRCGCGVQIQVSTRDEVVSTCCSVSGCRGLSVTGSAIRLCVDHKDEAVMLLASEVGRHGLAHLGRLAEEGAMRWRVPVIPVYEGPYVEVAEAASVVRELPLDGPHDPVVYFLLNGTRVKIGYTTNLKSRITALSLRHQSVLLLLDGGRELEVALHRRFHGHRISGTEWFNFSEEIQDFVKARPRRTRQFPDS